MKFSKKIVLVNIIVAALINKVHCNLNIIVQLVIIYSAEYFFDNLIEKKFHEKRKKLNFAMRNKSIVKFEQAIKNEKNSIIEIAYLENGNVEKEKARKERQ
ncbi:hypothetical protein BpHYR1_005359 [Brachionus plicatilis]|uniref:Uncharacterized protein n=1 Tax=Brachionus plicatilis TaxID=10195 RepID=A0A3M7R467_BRAPC|nr:hypothetical protein BpHYR1_005359 [Brachionus plicatilis]